MKYAYIALLFLVLYVAGMYESTALMVLFLVQLFLIPVMLALAVYLKRHLKAEAAENTVYTEVNIPFVWRLRTVNSGRLPVGRFSVRLRCGGRAMEKNTKIKVRGSAERGEELHSFRDMCVHCGTAVLRADKLRVYDYMSLFSSGQRLREEITVVAFPRKYEMNIEIDNSSGEEGDYSSAGNNYGEIRQIREYRDGDSIRHIHWNQTARSDKLWVKEYATEKAGRVRLFLELGDVKKYSASDLDAFYTLLYALVSVLLVSTMISVCLFMIELVNKHHIIPYLFVTAIMIGAPLFGISAGIVPAVFALVFLVLFMTVHTAEGGQRSASEKSKARIGLRCGVYMLAALAVLSAVSCMIVSRWSLEISDAVYAGEGAVSRSLQRITGTARSSDSDGRISSGNNYQTGETRLEVTLLDEPNETLYLKGFSGGDYIGGEWEEADDRRIFREMADVLRWDNWESWISGMYYSMYFIMNTAAADNARPHTMFVTHINETYNTIYTPYYSSRPNMNSSSGAGYIFNYFSQSDMTDDWENVSYDFRTASGWYRDIQNSYMQAMPKHYIQVPEDLVPRLSELCRDHPMTSRDDITEFIISTLQSRASYTLTPGRAPFNEDIVEYFLFENHEGYCVHFASAATLMYRLYGIPARYASGYAVEPEDFSRQDGDLWTAEVTDRSAHAWTEIFIENYGWVPVEVTPASDGSYDTFYPGMETDIPEETAAPESGSTPEEAADENEDNTDITIDTDESADASCDYFCDTGEDNYRAYIIAASVMILLISLMLHCRRIYMIRKIKEMDCRRVFGRFIRMLHSAGYMTGLYGTEKDFAAKLAEELPCVSLEEAERMIETVGRAAYGRDMPPEEETERVREIYFRTAGYIAESLKLIPRLRFKYISAFC